MARVVVVGGSFGGMAAAARLAKLGHQVTLYERAADLGGSLRPIRQDGFTWDTGPTTWTLPAVVRDLFRKSGRPLERVVELQPLSPGRRHIFPDGSELDL
ncbi:MAG TPA: NAD(P)-binding protein, partial [Nocardioidaceae bacterium]|nr:NAD(P)-binding protein [Nocardioidaceae bacterium]